MGGAVRSSGDASAQRPAWGRPGLSGPALLQGSRTTRRVRIVLVESDELVTQGLTHMLAPYEDRITLLIEHGARHEPADLVLVDPSVRAKNDGYWAGVLANVSEGRGLVVYTWAPSWGPAGQARLVAAGWPIRGWLSKRLPADVLVSAFERISLEQVVILDEAPSEDRRPHAAESGPGRGDLSPREIEVVWMIADGLTNQQIADETYLSINSVKTYIRSSYRKMGVTTRTQAVLWAVRHDVGAVPYHVVRSIGQASRDHRRGPERSPNRKAPTCGTPRPLRSTR